MRPLVDATQPCQRRDLAKTTAPADISAGLGSKPSEIKSVDTETAMSEP